MFLAESREDVAGRVHAMVGLLPAAVRMREHGLTLGYAEVTLTAPTLLGPAGTVVGGQEFHASTLGRVPVALTGAFLVRGPGSGERDEGYVVGAALMSYVHLHFASTPGVAGAFVDACAGGR
jgi:cobyrinic acid a,c-diamide synthase